MGSNFNKEVKEVYQKAEQIAEKYFNDRKTLKDDAKLEVSNDFKRDFFKIVDKVSLSLLDDKDSFYGYFLFQVLREIRFDINTHAGINFKGSKYVIYFNPLIFLRLNMKQMECAIKQEILHIVAIHPARVKDLRAEKISKFAIYMAMDIVVNLYLDYLPPYSTTLESVNNKYELDLEPYETLEYYANKLQTALDLLEENEDEGEEVDSDNTDENSEVETEFKADKNHDIWEESENVDDKTIMEFTQRVIDNANKSTNPTYLDRFISNFKNTKSELPWNIYLKKLMGTVESNKKKTITRRSRRQPNRLDLRGELRNHKANIAVALDTSGSISDEEFKQAIKEVLNIVKNYNHEITIIECDDMIREVYKIKSVKSIKNRNNSRGATLFSPVIEYANEHKINLLVYFTDGKGEERLKAVPRGYKVLWVISGRGDKLSLKENYGIVKKLSKVEIKEDNIDLSDTRTDGYSMMNSQASFF